MLGVPSVDLGFSGPYGVYHSIYDNFNWMQAHGDKNFSIHVAATQAIGLTLLRLLQSDILPFRHAELAKALEKEISDLPKQEELGDLKGKVSAFLAAAGEVDAAIQALLAGEIPAERVSALHEANDLMARLERRFLLAEGLPLRNWFRNLLYAPSLDSGYGTTLFPEIREASLRGDNEGRARGIIHLMAALDAAALDLKSAHQKLSGAPPPAPPPATPKAENKGGQ
jgi:N-acetylated-alpha-linked acidic dipeptidase